MASKRDATGRFLKGFSGNPKGRIHRAQEEQYLSLLKSCVSDQDVKEIVKRAVDKAKIGDYRARQWLFDYFWGRPRESIRLEGTGDIQLVWGEQEDGNHQDQPTEAA